METDADPVYELEGADPEDPEQWDSLGEVPNPYAAPPDLGLPD